MFPISNVQRVHPEDSTGKMLKPICNVAAVVVDDSDEELSENNLFVTLHWDGKLM